MKWDIKTNFSIPCFMLVWITHHMLNCLLLEINIYLCSNCCLVLVFGRFLKITLKDHWKPGGVMMWTFQWFPLKKANNTENVFNVIIMLDDRENSPVTQTPTPGHTAKLGLIALIRPLRPHCSRTLWFYPLILRCAMIAKFIKISLDI